MTMEYSRKVVFVGLCQTQALSYLYAKHVAPLLEEEVVYVELHPWLSADLVAQRLPALRGADLIVEQRFDTPSRIPEDLLSSSVPRVWHPYLHIGFLWPFSTQAHPLNQRIPWLLLGAYDQEMGDRFLNRMIREKVTPEVALQRYLDTDIVAATQVDRLMELNFEMLRERETRTDIRVADFIERHFRDEYLFHTKGHPTPVMMDVLTRQVFEALDVPHSLIGAVLRSPFGRTRFRRELPLHPAVIEHFRLSFATAEHRYRYLEEGFFNFAEFAVRYMNYTWNAQLSEGIMLSRTGSDNARALELLPPALERSPDSTAGWAALNVALTRVGRWDEAHSALDRAAQLDPQEVDVVALRAHTFLREGRLAEAEQSAREAIDLSPFAPAGHQVSVDLLLERGRPRAAVAAAKFAAGLDPSDVHARVKIGRCLLMNEEFAEAERVLRAALLRMPQSPAALGLLAEVLTRTDRVQEAAQIAAEACALEPTNAYHHTRHSSLLSRLGDVVGAERALRKAIELDPDNIHNRMALAAVLERNSQGDAALELLRPLVSAGVADSHAYSRFGRLLHAKGDREGAASAFRRAIELDPANVHHYIQLGDVLIRADNWLDAEPVLRHALQLVPGHLGAVNALATVLEKTDRVAAAAQLLQPLATAGTADAHTYNRLGRLLYGMGDLAGGEGALREAIALDPANVHHYIQLGELLNRAGNWPAAERMLRCALQLQPGHFGAINVLSSVLERAAQYEAALELLRPVAAAGSADAYMYNIFGRLLERVGDLSGAAAALRRAIELQPHLHSAVNVLAGVLEKTGAVEEALALVLPVVTAGTSDPYLSRRCEHLLARTRQLQTAHAGGAG